MSESDVTLRVLRLPTQQSDDQAGKMFLDPVTVFLEDFEPGRGQLTLVCWGRAWTHYWGAMGTRCRLRDFLLEASTCYLAGKLMLPYDVMLKRSESREERWLTQIVDAMKTALRREPGAQHD